MNKYVREDLKQFQPYHSPVTAYDIKLDANESPYPPHPEFIKHMSMWMENKDVTTRYPDTDAERLRQRIAQQFQKYNLQKKNVICSVGSDQLIDMITKVFIEPNDKIFVPEPSFSMYTLSGLLNHGQVCPYPLTQDFEYDIPVLLEKIKKEKPKLVFICTPNNPTGGIISRENLCRILDQVDCPVIVDEVYAEFSEKTMAGYLQLYPNLILLRSFSKAYGLAGLRIGYGLAHVDMIETLALVKPPYNVSTYAQEAGIFVLDHHDFYMAYIKETCQERKRMAESLKTFSHVEQVYPSETNFLLVRVKHQEIYQRLTHERIYIRSYGTKGPLGQCIRITIGTPEENNRVLKRLKEIEDETKTI